MTKHSRGNAKFLHNSIQDMLVHILEEQPKAWVKREWDVPSRLECGKYWVIDVADLTNRKHPVYYEVESDKSKTASTRKKQLALAKHTRIDLVIIPVWELDKSASLGEIEAWLRERVH